MKNTRPYERIATSEYKNHASIVVNKQEDFKLKNTTTHPTNERPTNSAKLQKIDKNN